MLDAGLYIKHHQPAFDFWQVATLLTNESTNVNMQTTELVQKETCFF